MIFTGQISDYYSKRGPFEAENADHTAKSIPAAHVLEFFECAGIRKSVGLAAGRCLDLIRAIVLATLSQNAFAVESTL